ncbi:MAG: hypothetical protein Q4B03_06325 [Lachnospiraceae bacterium]|nr:hypothetical protein [Lachnospiraceae bacterium]
MTRIHIRQIRETIENLKEQINGLRRIEERLAELEKQISPAQNKEAVQQTLALGRTSVEENIRILFSMASALEEVYSAYTDTEKRITDRYNLDTIVYPATEFGISKITGLDEYDDLMPF